MQGHRREISGAVQVQNVPEIMERRQQMLMFYGEHKVEKSLVIHLPVPRLFVLKDPLNTQVAERRLIELDHLFLRQSPVVIAVELQVHFVNSERIGCREPILFAHHPVVAVLCILLRRKSKFVEFPECLRTQYFGDRDVLLSVLRIEGKYEFAHSVVNIVWMERLVDIIEFGDHLDLISNEHLQVVLGEMALWRVVPGDDVGADVVATEREELMQQIDRNGHELMERKASNLPVPVHRESAKHRGGEEFVCSRWQSVPQLAEDVVAHKAVVVRCTARHRVLLHESHHVVE